MLVLKKSQQHLTKPNMYLFNHIHFYKLLYWKKEGNVLFNDAINTFYLPLYGGQTYGKEPYR